jgi:hypothetical protein
MGGEVRLSEALHATREALRREIGPPTERDRNWQPMISAHEVRLLLDAVDRVEALADEWERRSEGFSGLHADADREYAARLRAALTARPASEETAL